MVVGCVSCASTNGAQLRRTSSPGFSLHNASDEILCEVRISSEGGFQSALAPDEVLLPGSLVRVSAVRESRRSVGPRLADAASTQTIELLDCTGRVVLRRDVRGPREGVMLVFSSRE